MNTNKLIRAHRLTDGIIEAQRKEIRAMVWLLEDMENNGKETSEGEVSRLAIPELTGEVNGDAL